MPNPLSYMKRRLGHVLRRLGLIQSETRSELELRSESLSRFISYKKEPRSAPLSTFDPDRLRITCVIPDFQIGAGGHMTIFRILHYLEKFGHEVTILIQNPTDHETAEQAKETINNHFQAIKGEVLLFEQTLPDVEGDALIATDRFTCFPVNAMGKFIRKFYLVQDYEPFFYHVGSEYLLTERTYRFDFDCLCAGEWLSEKMTRDYGRWAIAWQLAHDQKIYNHDTENELSRSPNKIAFYARYVTPRRAVELAFLALELLHERGVSFEIDFFGWDVGNLSVGYPYNNHGIINEFELADLYRQATIGLVFSATNHSLVDKEMMACGLPVVELDQESVRAVFPEDVLTLSEAAPEAIADCLQNLLADEAERKRLREAGLEYVHQFSWEKSARLVEASLKERVDVYRKKEQ